MIKTFILINNNQADWFYVLRDGNQPSCKLYVIDCALGDTKASYSRLLVNIPKDSIVYPLFV